MYLFMLYSSKKSYLKAFALFFVLIFMATHAVRANGITSHCSGQIINSIDFNTLIDSNGEKKTLTKAEKRNNRKRSKLKSNKWSKY
jgi:hypothetical protein